MKNTWTAIYTLTLMLLVGCVSTNDNQGVNIPKNNIDYNSLKEFYVKLEKVDKQYRLTEYSTQYKVKEPWVRVRDGKPMWKTSIERGCKAGGAWNNFQGKKCLTINPQLFMVHDYDVGSNVFATVSTLGVGAAYKLGDVVFDLQSFTAAYNQAIAEDGGKQVISSTLSQVGKLFDGINNEYAQVKQKYSNNIKKIEKTIKIQDKSMLWSSSLYDFANDVKISPNRLIPSDLVVKSPLTTLLSKVQTENKNLRAKWEHLGSFANVQCKKHYQTFNYQLGCETTVALDSNKVNKLNVLVNIDSYKAKKLLPKTFLISDNSVEFVFRNEGFEVTNKTNEYININELSFFYRENIASLNNIDITLPPQSKSVLPHLSEFNVKWLKLNLGNINKELAVNTNLDFGMAASYSLVDQNIRKTLFTKDSYQVIDLIQ